MWASNSRRSLLQFSRSMSSTILRPIRPSDWKSAAPEPLPGTATFAAQPSLPRLPVPDLKQTLDRLRESLKPIAWSDAEYSSVLRKIDTFANDLGLPLQQRLLNRANERPHWLEEWWDNVGYLGHRESVVVNVSYYYGFDSAPTHLPQSPVSRAAGIARATMIFRQQLKQGLIKPDTVNGTPLCMDTYRWMFDCCRVPNEGLDWSVSYATPGDLGNSGHIIVLRKNRVWKVEVTHNGRLLSTPEIEKQIQYIYDNTLAEYPGVGVLTASNRDIWTKDYLKLRSKAHNNHILDAIHSSAFIICLDSSQPKDSIHHSRALWHGDVIAGIPVGLRNRWVDKPLQFIIFDNAYAGIMGEHSVMDGTPTARMCDDILNMLYDPGFDHGTSSGEPILSPQPLDWEISPEITQAIGEADHAARELVEGQELGFYLTSYGKAAIKTFAVSPDSWAQMIIHLAYKRLLGNKKRTGATYEAASVRKFYKGRTETIRVVTSEGDAWANSMDDDQVTPNTRKKLFDLATRKHISLAVNGGQGQGVDRHLFGLRNLLKEGEELPELYSDPVFKRSSYWVLSTSAIFSKHFPVYGWGEVVPDGFGVAYMTGYNDRLQFTVTSRKEMPNAQFIEEIAKAANDLFALHEATTTKPRL